MPLLNGAEHQRRLVAPSVKANDEVMVLRFTGEVFKDYEDYLRCLELYRQRMWTCGVTGKSGMTYEEALASEAVSHSLLQPFPETLEPIVCRLAHHSTLRLDQLLASVSAFLQSGFVAGEQVLGTHDGQTMPCRIIAARPQIGGAAERDELSAGGVDAATPAAYEVEWIIDGMQGGAFMQLPTDALTREQPLPSKLALRSALQRMAKCEPVDGVPGIPCLWRVRPPWQQRFHLPQDLPPDLAERLQQRKAPSRSPAASAAALLREHGIPEAAAFAASPGPGSLAVAELAAAAEEAAEAAQPVEALEETEARLPPGSVKRGIFEVLRDAGPEGAGLQDLIDGLAERGIKTWPEARIAKSSIASTCGHDRAFVRVGAGQFALRAITHLPEVAPSRNATLGQKAAAAIAAVQAKEAAVLQQLEDDTGAAAAPAANTLKCPRCHRVHHPEGSPLVLCDGCPRAYHLACMRGVAWTDLPTGEWHCPRCTERRGSALRKLADFEARKHEALEKVAVAEREKDERSRRRQAEREQRDAVKAMEREERERQKAAALAEREAQRAAARRAARFPLDDWQAVEEEQAHLRRAEARAAELAAIASQLQTAHDGGAAAAAARKAAEAAAERRRLVEGPQALQSASAPEAHWGPLADALAVVEFVRVFGSIVGVEPVSLQGLREAARWPLDSDVLPRLYLSLLHCLLREQVAMTTGVFKSQSRRWARCVNSTTWPEVLRRYLLFSRAMVSVPLAAVEGLQPHQLDDQAVAVAAAKALSQQPWHKLSGPLHLRLLASLAADVTNCGQLRITLAEREAILASLTVDRQKEMVEEKKRAREDDMLRREEEKALRDSLGSSGSGLPPDLLVYRGESEDEEALEQWQQRRAQAQADGYHIPGAGAAQAEARLAELAEERQGAVAAREAAEAAHEAAVEAATIRGEPLGCDRADRHYWWFPDEAPGAIFIEDGTGPVGLITSTAQLAELRARLNPRGCREKALAAALERRADELAAALDGGATPALDLDAVPRALAAEGQEPAPAEQLISRAESATLRAAAEALETTLGQLYDTFGALLDGSMKEWRRRCRGVEGLQELQQMLLDAEKLAAPLMDGLPRHAHDEAMAAWPTDPVALLPPLPRDLAAEAAAANETRQQRRLQRHRERLKELREEAAAKAEGRPWPPPGGLHKPARNDDDSGSDDDDKGNTRGDSAPPAAPPQPQAPAGPPVFELPVLPEMDISDAEKMELKAAENGGERERRRHPPRCSLWRSARERAVWLHDVRSSAAAADVHGLAYAAAVYCDRCQPLLVKAAKLAAGEVKPSRASTRGQDAAAWLTTAAPATATAAAATHSGGSGNAIGAAAANGTVAGSRRQRTTLASGGAGGGGARLRIKLGGALGGGTIERAGTPAERNNTPVDRAGTPDTISDVPSWNPGKRSSSPADDATGGISSAQPSGEPPKPVTKLKLHFGGSGGARVFMPGSGSPGIKAEPGASPAAASPAQSSQDPPPPQHKPLQQQGHPPPWYSHEDSGSGDALFPRVPTKKRRRKMADGGQGPKRDE